MINEMVQKWFILFRCGCTSTSDAQLPLSPIKIAIPEIIGIMHDRVLAIFRLKVREIG